MSHEAGSAADPKTYNVRYYQNPDAGAADQPLTKAGKGKGKGKFLKGGDTTNVVAKLSSCSQCHRAYYCDHKCQRRDWQRHKRACVAAVAAEAKLATRAREATAAARAAGGRPANETCVICIGPVVAPVEREEASCASLAEAVSSLADSPK